MCLLSIILFNVHKSSADVGEEKGQRWIRKKILFLSKRQKALKAQRGVTPDPTSRKGFRPRTLPHSHFSPLTSTASFPHNTGLHSLCTASLIWWAKVLWVNRERLGPGLQSLSPVWNLPGVGESQAVARIPCIILITIAAATSWALSKCREPSSHSCSEGQVRSHPHSPSG